MTAAELQIDVTAEEARALHRIVRAMHDGHCPKCGHLGPADDFLQVTGDHVCPHVECGFTVTAGEARSALAAFQPHLHKSVELFEQWRAGVVYCHGCSVAGGADMPVYHAPPACK